MPHDETPAAPIEVRRWPTERVFLILNALAAAGVWSMVLAAPYGFLYVVSGLGIMFLTHAASIVAVRGSGVRLGREQFPDLYTRVEELARGMGLRRMPDVYLLQQDGALNAFATRFLRSNIVVLFADLLEACGDNRAARDMIIAHELGHVRAGHLLWNWFLMPVAFVPFLGSALSRAREYTCDRYGLAGAADRDGALLGLTILAVGGRYAPQVNRAALVAQRRDLRGAWMLLGEWLGSHPPLAKRLNALAAELAAGAEPVVSTPFQWLRTAFASAGVLAVGLLVLAMWLPGLRARGASLHMAPPVDVGTKQVAEDFKRLTGLIEADLQSGRPLPWDIWDLYGRWAEVHPDSSEPTDPFSGYWYDYDQQGGAYRLRSMGPDGEQRTADDIVHDSRSAEDR